MMKYDVISRIAVDIDRWRPSMMPHPLWCGIRLVCMITAYLGVVVACLLIQCSVFAIIVVDVGNRDFDLLFQKIVSLVSIVFLSAICIYLIRCLLYTLRNYRGIDMDALALLAGSILSLTYMGAIIWQ